MQLALPVCPLVLAAPAAPALLVAVPEGGGCRIVVRPDVCFEASL
jgi:hypothetical protein